MSVILDFHCEVWVDGEAHNLAQFRRRLELADDVRALAGYPPSHEIRVGLKERLMALSQDVEKACETLVEWKARTKR